jgi:hypothetical protein
MSMLCICVFLSEIPGFSAVLLLVISGYALLLLHVASNMVESVILSVFPIGCCSYLFRVAKK